MTNPGIEPSQNDDAAPGVQQAKKSKRRFPLKTLLAAAVLGGGALALSHCEGGKDQSKNASNAPVLTPVDTQSIFYRVLEQGQMRAEPQSEFIPNRYIQQGSCVRGMVDGEGKQIYGKFNYRVLMTEENGKVSEAYIHVGNLARVDRASLTQGCIATFKGEYTARPTVPNFVPTFTNAANTINIRDVPDAHAEVWGTLAPDSCVMATGDRQNNMMQIGLITDSSAPNPVDYKWVRIQDMHNSGATIDQCRSSYTTGGQAGITPNPWRP